MSQDDEDLWDEFKESFINSFIDTAAKEHAMCDFSNLEQKGDGINDYIIRFNNLSSHLKFNHKSQLLIDKFYDRLAKGIRTGILRHDIWPETLDEWQEAACHMVQCNTIRRERVGGRGSWNLSTKAACWKEALEGNNKGACQKSRTADEDKMQIDLAQIGDDNPHLQKLISEMRLKLI
jgi:hypothetical protein